MQNCNTLYYNIAMSNTLTIRADKTLRAALEARARMQGASVSEVVREILTEALAERPLADRTAHLKGNLALSPEPTDPWRKRVKERNWRP